MNRKLPTCGQIERDLSQQIQKLYRQQLGHSPSKVICKLFDNRLAIIIEDSLTILQKTLIEEDNQNETAKYVNLAINNVIKSKLKVVIEEILNIEVYDILFDSSSKTQQSGAIAILTQAPLVRNRQPMTEIIKSQSRDKSIQNKSGSIDNETSDSATELKSENI